jgi:hypothetical protein
MMPTADDNNDENGNGSGEKQPSAKRERGGERL